MKLPLWVVVLVYLTCWPAAALSQPLFATETGDVRIVLTDDPCALTENVRNLPFKATWTEKGQEQQGCWGVRQDEGIVVGYFDDLTVAIIQMRDFKKLLGV